MNLEQYTPKALATALPTALHGDYLGPALLAEAHELAAAVYSYDAKLVRDGDQHEEALANAIVKEAGDVAWPTAVILHITEQDIAPEELARARTIIDAGRLADPHAELIRRAGLVNDYLAFNNPLGQWLAYSEAWALWHHLEDNAETMIGRPLTDALEANVLKLADRAARGVLAGSGDNR